ncbi:MAG: branched-chain amino acid ABC transporter permease, partial [Polaromonas sp.]
MMFSQLLQFLFSGLTVGATYALAALGFAIIYNASGVINFAQGEFIMLGGMAAVALAGLGLPLPLAIVLAVVVAGITGVLIEKLAIEPAGGADVVPLIIITIGASLVVRGLVQILLGKGTHSLPAFSGETPLVIAGATLLPQSLWVVGVAAVVVAALGWFFGRTVQGKAMLATSHNKLAAELVGINTRSVLLLSFVLSGALGALGGILVAPITYTSYDVGIMLGLKGFVAATLGGLGSGLGAVVGGLLLGVLEAMTAGYISSAYKDAMPFVLIL